MGLAPLIFVRDVAGRYSNGEKQERLKYLFDLSYIALGTNIK